MAKRTCLSYSFFPLTSDWFKPHLLSTKCFSHAGGAKFSKQENTFNVRVTQLHFNQHRNRVIFPPNFTVKFDFLNWLWVTKIDLSCFTYLCCAAHLTAKDLHALIFIHLMLLPGGVTFVIPSCLMLFLFSLFQICDVNVTRFLCPVLFIVMAWALLIQPRQQHTGWVYSLKTGVCREKFQSPESRNILFFSPVFQLKIVSLGRENWFNKNAPQDSFYA